MLPIQTVEAETIAGSSYLPTLDGWRAIAIIAVVVSHAQHTLSQLGVNSPRILLATSWGRLGVDLFFAISGFLICSRLLHEFNNRQTILLKSFYVRRGFRILPLYFSYLLVVYALSKTTIFPVSGEELKSCLFFYRNYITTPDGMYTNHFWSLSVEEHFYVVWPLFILCTGPARARWLVPVIALCVNGWRGIDAHYHVFSHLGGSANIVWRTDTRIDALLWGCWAALVYSHRPVRFSPWVPIGAILALVAGVYFEIPMLPLFLALIFPVLILGTVSNPQAALSRALEWAPLRLIGRLSYSLYVWQTLFLQVSVSPDPTWIQPLKYWPTNMLAIVTTALLSHYLIERPMIWLGRSCLKKLQIGTEPVTLPPLSNLTL